MAHAEHCKNLHERVLPAPRCSPIPIPSTRSCAYRPLGVGTAGPRRRHDRQKIHLNRRILILGDGEVIHSDSRVDLGSSHHFMHNGEEINLEPQSPITV